MTTKVVSIFGEEDSGDTRRGLVHQVGPFFGKNTSFVTQKTDVLNIFIKNNSFFWVLQKRSDLNKIHVLNLRFPGKMKKLIFHHFFQFYDKS